MKVGCVCNLEIVRMYWRLWYFLFFCCNDKVLKICEWLVFVKMVEMNRLWVYIWFLMVVMFVRRFCVVLICVFLRCDCWVEWWWVIRVWCFFCVVLMVDMLCLGGRMERIFGFCDWMICLFGKVVIWLWCCVIFGSLCRLEIVDCWLR